jgi:hypothetical protein
MRDIMATSQSDAKIHIAKLLTECTSINDAQSRQIIIGLLPAQVRNKLPSQAPPLLANLVDFISKLLEYRGMVADFLRYLREFEGDTIQVELVTVHLEGLARQPTASQLESLKIMLDQLPASTLHRHYQASFPGLPGFHGPSQSLEEMISTLARAPADQIYPLVEFVARVARSHPKVQPDLSVWMASMSKAHPEWAHSITLVEHKLNQESAYQPDPVVYLVVKIEPTQTHQHRLYAWIMDEAGLPIGGQEHSLIEGLSIDAGRLSPGADSGPASVLIDLSPERSDQAKRQDLALIMRALIDQIDTILEVKDLRIEFVLPINLLRFAVDQIPYSTGPFQTPLGKKYRITVRSYERIYKVDPDLADIDEDWFKKWRAADLVIQQRQAPAPVWVCDQGNCAPDDLFETLNTPDQICVVLTMMPPGQPGGADDVLWTIIYSATPIAIWSRLDSAAEVEAGLRTILHGQPLCDLPQQIYTARQKAGRKQPNDPGHHLTLLWDTRERIPPDTGLATAPSKRLRGASS